MIFQRRQKALLWGKGLRSNLIRAYTVVLKSYIAYASLSNDLAPLKICNIFPNFLTERGMIIHENRLPADDSHEISYLICYF